jgi:hypothetical protein
VPTLDILYAARPEIQIGNSGLIANPSLILDDVLKAKDGEKACFT